MMTKRWTVDIFIDERDSTTHAEARLHTNEATRLSGYGRARRNPGDFEVPEIADELAVARALSELAHMLLQVAAEDIEQITHEPVSLHG